MKGGVYYNVAGARPEEVLEDAVRTLPVPEDPGRQAFLRAILEREELMPTAVGNGIALPHPRNPLIRKNEDQFIAVCFLDRPVDWQALDGKPVSTLVFIVSASPKIHLSILSRVSFLCQEPDFRALLAERASTEELAAAVAAIEARWAHQ